MAAGGSVAWLVTDLSEVLKFVGALCLSAGRIQEVEVSEAMGNPHGWFIRENPTKIDDFGVPLFLETTIYIYIISLGIQNDLK